MSAPLLKRTILAVALLVLVAVVVAISLPLVASTQIVRTAIAYELGQRTGHRVTLGGAPDIRVWPGFHAVLRDVTLADDQAAPVLEAERIAVGLSAWRALTGAVAITSVTFDRPVLRISAASGQRYVPAGTTGTALPAPAASAGIAKPIGTITFNDGRLLLAGPETELASSVTGTLSWPALDQPASLLGSGIWRGETVAVSLQLDRPAALIGGEPSAVTASMRAAPFGFEFKGSLRRGANVSFDGQVSAETPSLRRTLDWFGAGKGPKAAVGAVSLAGKVSGDATRIRVDDARLVVAGNQGTGALDASFAEPLPTVSGTLAFDTLDIDSFLAAFTPRQEPAAAPTAPAPTPGAPAFDLSVTDQFSLDLRLSAARATGGPLTFSEVAATAQLKPGLAAFDISDARAFGGNIQAGFRVDRKPDGDVGEVRISATDIDWAALAEAGGWRRNPPRARGGLSVMLKGRVADRETMPATLTGSIAVRFGQGSIEGVNFDQFMERVAQGGFFPLAEVSKGSLVFDGAEIKASVIGAAARIESARGWDKNVEIVMSGIVPYIGRGLALNGVVRSREGAEPGREPRHFFVGGSWSTPYVSPMLPIHTPQ